jgi:hypothetical protein
VHGKQPGTESLRGGKFDFCDRASASIILSIVYDLPENLSLNHSVIAGMNDLSEEAVKAAAPGAHLVEFFPWMLYIPSSLAKWKRDAQNRFKKYCELFGGLFRDLEKRLASLFLFYHMSPWHLPFAVQAEGESERPSFVGYLVQQRENHKLSDIEAWWVAATL